MLNNNVYLFSAIACRSSDNNITRAGFTVNWQRNAHLDHV